MRRLAVVLIVLTCVLGHITTCWAGNTVTRWVEQALDTVRAGGSNVSNQAASRLYAMTTTAMYDAVNGIDRVRFLSTREHALVPPTGAPFLGNRFAAAAAAAHAVLVALQPTRQSVLDAALNAELTALGGATAPAVAAGRTWGAAVGAQIVALRANDGTQTSETQPACAPTPCTPTPGQFPRSFSGAQYRNMTPFGVTSMTPYASSGPPALTSAEYTTDFNEVKVIGSITDTDLERGAIAGHWLAEAGSVRESGLWLKATLNIAEEQGTVFLLSRTARLFALLGMGIADSIATSWTAKFDDHFWRPGDAIRGAESDGNPDTAADLDWAPRTTGSPPANFGGTPEHTSGTSTLAGASSTILAGFYCRDDISFTFVSEGTPASTRSYQSFGQAADEAGRSRIYSGIHFQFSNRAGREAGNGIGTEIVNTRLVRFEPCSGIFCTCPQL